MNLFIKNEKSKKNCLFFVNLTSCFFLTGCWTYWGHQICPPENFSPHLFHMKKIYTDAQYAGFILEGSCSKHDEHVVRVCLDYPILRYDWLYLSTTDEKLNFHPLGILKRLHLKQNDSIKSLVKYIKPFKPEILQTIGTIDSERYFEITGEYQSSQEVVSINTALPSVNVLGIFLCVNTLALDLITAPVQVPFFMSYAHTKKQNYKMNPLPKIKRIPLPKSWSKNDIILALQAAKAF
jgi:hypothetical protein